MPPELRDYRLLQIGVDAAAILDAPALWLDGLLAVDDMVKEANANAGRVDSRRDRPGPP